MQYIHRIALLGKDFDLFKYLIDNGAEIDSNNNYSRTPLGCFAYALKNDYDIRFAKLLLIKGAKVSPDMIESLKKKKLAKKISNLPLEKKCDELIKLLKNKTDLKSSRTIEKGRNELK